MANFRFNLDVTYKSKQASAEASKLLKEGKKIPKSLYNPSETAIYISTSFGSKYIKVNSGLKIRPEDFDVKTQSIKLRDSKSVQFQLLLNRIKDDCLTQYREIMLNKEELNSDVVKTIILKAIKQDPDQKKELTFFEIYEQFYLWKSKTVNPRTMPRYSVLKKELSRFEKHVKKPLSIHSIDKRFGEEFSLFLIDDIKITNNTIFRYLKSLKCFLNYCLENELTLNKKFKKIKAQEEATSIFVLTESEIQTITKLHIENQSLREVRDIFCFLCYTGQRYSDVKRLQWKDIINTENYSYWKLFQYKTRATASIEIPLLPEAISLIENRKQFGLDDYVFNVISNQKMNSQLKTLGKLAKLKGQFTTKRIQGNKLIEITQDRALKLSTHCGRKSFITLALRKGVPITVVQKISGHATLKAMKPYISLSEDYVAEALLAAFS